MFALVSGFIQVIERIACMAGGSVSWFGCYQPQEPKELFATIEK